MPRPRKPKLYTNVAPRKKLAPPPASTTTQHPRPADKLRVQAWARELLRQPFYVLDTETTGIAKKDEIVQIGILDQDGTLIMNQRIKPTQPIPRGASQVHGIYDADVADAPTFADVYDDLSVTLAGVPLVAYNMDFDWRMLQQTSTLYRLPAIRTGTRHCAMKQYAIYWGAWNTQQGAYRRQKLGNASQQQQIPVLDAHDAIGDCRMTLALIHKMAGD